MSVLSADQSWYIAVAAVLYDQLSVPFNLSGPILTLDYFSHLFISLRPDFSCIFRALRCSTYSLPMLSSTHV